MNRTTLDFLFRAESPWVHLGQGEPERKDWNYSQFYSRPGRNVCVRKLRGNKMRTIHALMDEFAAAFQFFEEFGENWYALEECLEYLDEWLVADAYIIVIERADEMLCQENKEEIASCLKVLETVGDFWSKPIKGNGRFDRDPKPFHSLLNLSKVTPYCSNNIEAVANDTGIKLC